MRARPDVLITGGGPAGAAAACRLAGAGFEVLLCEREQRPRPRVCGEFLSVSTVAELGDLGLPPRSLGAVAIERLRLAHGEHEAVGPLPAGAAGLSREVLDEHLLERARAAGAAVRRGLAVRRLEPVGGRWRALLGDDTHLEVPLVALATGKHDLRGHPRPRPARGGMIGFRMQWRLAGAQAAALAGQIELVLFDGGYAGLQPVDGGRANLCLVLRAAALARHGRSWPGLLAHLRASSPLLRRRLERARPVWPQPATIAGMPYGHVHAGSGGPPGLYRLGDQFAVIPSFTGEGIALALRTARLAAAALIAGEAAEAYHAAARAEVLAAVRHACAVARLTDHRLGRRAALGLARVPGVLAALDRRLRLPPARAFELWAGNESTASPFPWGSRAAGQGQEPRRPPQHG